MLADWKPDPKYPKLPNGTTKYFLGEEMSLLREMVEMPDCQPTFSHGGGKVQPWVVATYAINSEIELVDFLYCFVRLLKPMVVLETGCFMGFMSYALGRAVKDNGFGQVVTCDNDLEKVALTENRVKGLPVTVMGTSALSPEMDEWYAKADFAFLDADEDTRPESFKRLRSGCVAVCHDTRQEPWAELIPQKSDRIVFDETQKGFTLFRKA